MRPRTLEQQCFDYIVQLLQDDIQWPDHFNRPRIEADWDILYEGEKKMREAWNLIRKSVGEKEIPYEKTVVILTKRRARKLATRDAAQRRVDRRAGTNGRNEGRNGGKIIGPEHDAPPDSNVSDSEPAHD